MDCQLIVTLPYFVADDRTALAFICVLSATLWVVSALLFARLIVRLTRLRGVSWLSTALALLFLADLQFQTAYFNGLETGLYLTVVLALLVWTTHRRWERPSSAGRCQRTSFISIGQRPAFFSRVAGAEAQRVLN